MANKEAGMKLSRSFWCLLTNIDSVWHKVELKRSTRPSHAGMSALSRMQFLNKSVFEPPFFFTPRQKLDENYIP